MVIDTGIIIEHISSKNKLKTTLYNLPADAELFITSVSLYELHMGATSPEKENIVNTITEGLSVLPFSDLASLKAAKIYHQLRLSNKMIEFRDIFIAATCLVNDLPLVTLNKKHFTRIKGLKIL